MSINKNDDIFMNGNLETFSKMLNELDLEELDNAFKTFPKDKYPVHYKLLRSKVNQESIYNVDFFKHHIRDYNIDELYKLKQRIKPDKFPEHFKLILDKISDLDVNYVPGTVDKLYNPETEPQNDQLEVQPDEQDKQDEHNHNHIPSFTLKKGLLLTMLVLSLLQVLIFIKILLIEQPAFYLSEEYFYTVELMEIMFYCALFTIITKFILSPPRITFKHLGWHTHNLKQNLLLGITVYFPLGVIVLITKLSSTHINFDIDWDINNPLSIALTVITTAIVAPIIEEIFFRGYLLQAIKTKIINTHLSYFVNAAIFTIAHIAFFDFEGIRFKPFIFVIGYISSYLYDKTKSLVPSIAFHISNNALICFVELIILFG